MVPFYVTYTIGIVIGGRLAIERTGQGDSFTATLAGLVCVTSLGDVGWALHDRA